MASPMSSRCKVTNNLHKMFEILEMNMNPKDSDRFKTRVLMSGILGEFWKKDKSLEIPRKLYKCDAYTFLRFLESKDFIDDTNIKIVQDTIKSVRPDLYELASSQTKHVVEVDPVVTYLERTAPFQPHEFIIFDPISVAYRRSERLKKRKCEYESTSEKIERKMKKKRKSSTTDSDQTCSYESTSYPSTHCRQIHSCDVRLRVKVEYVDHQEVLGSSVHSHKQHEVERQFEMFNQASTILKSRDLGTVVCDIKFAELTSLDAFWRDYTNGALLEALKVVFITESLNEAVGHEPLRLLVSIDEEDYRKGRLKLLKNLTD